MVDTTVHSQLLEQLDKLPLPKQQRVVEFAKSLTEPVPSASGRDFLELCGILPPEDAEEMRRTIEEECERIDPDGWK